MTGETLRHNQRPRVCDREIVPIELAILRLRNMSEVLSHWKIYVPNADFLTQRGGTFLIDNQGQRDRGILGFAENMSRPLSLLADYSNRESTNVTNN